MDRLNTPTPANIKYLISAKQVPSIKYQLIIVIIFLSLIPTFHLQHIHCEQIHQTFHRLRPESSQYDFSMDASQSLSGTNQDVHSQLHWRTLADSSNGPTPPLDSDLVFSIKNKRFVRDKLQGHPVIESSSTLRFANPPTDLDPFRGQYLGGLPFDNPQPDSDPFTNYTSTSHPEQNSPESTDGFDLIEFGLSGWPVQPVEDTYFNFMEDTTTVDENTATLYEVLPTAVLKTQHEVLPTASVSNDYNRSPILNRRLPKLVVTAGLSWHYSLPYDTFLDEDGDLRQLNLTIMERKSANISASDTNSDLAGPNDQSNRYFSWIQYDEASLSLYGLPTEKDIGVHEFLLVVTDRWGSVNEETFEVNVRQHQSARAHTHLLVVNRISWDRSRYQSMVSALKEVTKSISSKVYNDNSDNMVIRYYNLNDQNANIDRNGKQPSAITTSFDLAWFNSSIPIHPCNISQIEQLSRVLIDSQAVGQTWSLLNDAQLELPPSNNLLRALETEFSPTSINIQLMGSCENRDSPKDHTPDNIDVAPRVKIKLGKLTRKLGEPIEYKIPLDTFTAEKGTMNTADMQLSLHNIDGLPLDKDSKYDFLEFDQETQTLFGLPYDQTNHAGQRELQLTARHPKTQEKVREVFVLSIEPQDLTSINNRAFMMSLYLGARTMAFGPRERVMLTYKIAEALMMSEYDRNSTNSDFTVMEVQRFSFGDERSNKIDTHKQEDRIIRVNDNRSSSNSFYKFSWTNSTIGDRGDCPVEVIKENVLLALEQSMLRLPSPMSNEDPTKNDSARFFDRLHLYFEPESDLIHLRFEPLGACLSALELHDVGNSDLADRVDRASEGPIEFIQEMPGPNIVVQNEPVKNNHEPMSDEYWSIVVLIILVMALIFVIIMFFLGMHTYKVNQDKRFELQVKLAQARQNSMYLSSIMLANQGYSGPNGTSSKPLYMIPEEEKGPRKPVILDNEKQLLTNGVQKSSLAVQTNGQAYQTTPVNHNTTFALDASLSNHQPVGMHYSPSSMSTHMLDKQRSVTLNRRLSNQRLSGHMNVMHPSHSILTVASLAGPVPINSQIRLPVVYAQAPPMVGTPLDQGLFNYSSLQRQTSFQNPSPYQNGVAPMRHSPHPRTIGNDYSMDHPIDDRSYTPKIVPQHVAVNNISVKTTRSPSYSSSNSMTAQSIISNPNYVPQNLGFL